MRKIFNKLAIILTTSNLVLPLTACTYNFYSDSTINVVIKSYANQTSSVIKSLILGKEISADTSQTIQDILAKFPNVSIQNQTRDKNLSTVEEFSDAWGFNKNINISGFNLKDYFLANGTGKTTQQVNSYKNTNSIFNTLNLLPSLNLIDNSTLYNLIKSDNVKDTIVNFLNKTKNIDKNQLDTITILLKNIVLGKDWSNPDQNAFTKSVTDPLTSLLNYLINGLWNQADNQSTPATKADFEKFMTNWVDAGGKPYSQWNSNNKWAIQDSDAAYADWNPNDYNFYRSGVLVNHLFYQIGKDYSISKFSETEKVEYKDRYLGDIISDHLIPGNALPSLNTDEMMSDLQQYLPYLLQDPSYIMTLIEALIPIIKQWLLKMDVTKGLKYLTIGNKYTTNPDSYSYNVLDILNNLKALLANPGNPKDAQPDTLSYVLESLLGMKGDTSGKSFAYDIKLTIIIFGTTAELPLGGISSLISSQLESLIQTLIDLLTTDEIKNTFNNILNIYNQWIKQYNDTKIGINFDLTKLQDFLLNDTNGLITIINRDLIPQLYEIMSKEEEVTDDVYNQFYKNLGGKLPEGNNPAPIEFEPNSILDLLKSSISNTEIPLGQIILILLGNSSNNNVGLFATIANNNNQWIETNYTKYFDVINNSRSLISNQTMISSINGNEISAVLTYNFNYKINNKTYYFWIRCKAIDYKDSFIGIKNFYFTDIILRTIK